MARNKSTTGPSRKSAPPRTEASKAGSSGASAKPARRSVPPSSTALRTAETQALVKTESGSRPSAAPKAKRSKESTATAKGNGHGSKAFPSQEAIAARAYELYVASGYQDGHAEDHWLQAERELRQAN